MSRLAHPVVLGTERRITDVGVKRISSGLLPIGTVLMSSRAPVGYLAITSVPTAINQGFIAMICDGSLPPTFILNWAFNSMETIKARASGVLTHGVLLQRVWGPERVGESWLIRDVVKRVRRKLGETAADARFIFTEPRVGYRMAVGGGTGL